MDMDVVGRLDLLGFPRGVSRLPDPDPEVPGGAPTDSEVPG